MVYTKQISAVVLGIAVLAITTFAYVSTVFADDENKKEPLTAEQSNAIIQNCGNIKQSLSKLEHSDLRTRTYLGTAYESINGHFITPLNLRLVKNSLPSDGLFRIQNDFATEQANFRNNYINYMRELESLIAIDCVIQPQEFYDKLEIVREKRATLRDSTKRLAALAEDQYESVDKLRESL